MRLVESETAFWLSKAEALFNIKIEPLDILFDLKGRTSGMFCTSLSGSGRGNHHWIRYNPWIFARHIDESLATTVPHEVAHYVCFLLYGRSHKPHGREWKAIMNQFGVPANATCKLDISDVPQKKLKRFAYRCSCSKHELTSIRHNRIVRGQSVYCCPKCHSKLKAII